MPNSLTHKYTSGEIYRRLPEDIRKIIDKHRKAYDIGSLGPDTIMGLMLSKDIDKKLAGDRLHTLHIFEGIFNTAEYLRQHRDESEDELMAYFFGYLTHYATDCTIHPMVYAYITYRMSQKFDPVLNGCLHTIVETEMDTYIGNNCLHGKNANSFWCFRWNKSNLRVLEKFFLKVNKDTYHLTLTRKDIAESLFWYSFMMFMCQRHKNGVIRYKLIEQLDKMLKANHLLMSALRPRKLDSRYDYLNMKKYHYHAIYGDFSSEMEYHSFPELLTNAVDLGVDFVTRAWTHINGGEKLYTDLFKKSFNSDLNKEYCIAHGLPLPDVPPTEVPSIPPEILAEAGKLYGFTEEQEAVKNAQEEVRGELDLENDFMEDLVDDGQSLADEAKEKAEEVASAEDADEQEEEGSECANAVRDE